jgi:uncharacterized protein YuzE
MTGDPRPEGVYCHWESYPADTPGIEDNILVIERVNADGSVRTFDCARSEAAVIADFLKK